MALIRKDKIGLITTVSNWDLYGQTRHYFPEGIQHFVIDGTQRLYGIKSIAFFLKKIKRYDLDWLIMVDEDVVFTKPNNVFELIANMEANNYTVCGMRDGGTLHWRNKNPHMINHFFAVLNLKEIYSIYREKEMMRNQYIEEDEFSGLPNDLKFQNYDPNSLFEPYYRFYLWLLRKGKKIKYLEASNPIEGDYATTLLYDQEGNELLYHTWYARFYGKNQEQTKRIDKVISKFKPDKGDISMKDPIILKDDWYSLRYKIYSLFRRMKRKIS